MSGKFNNIFVGRGGAHMSLANLYFGSLNPKKIGSCFSHISRIHSPLFHGKSKI